MLKFIDARCSLGRRGVLREGMPATTEDILELMDRCNIEKAIAFHITAKEADMEEGNRLILDEAKKNDRFMPQWCAMPSTFGEFMGTKEFFDGMKANGVKTMRLLPKTCAYSLKPYALGELMGAAAECRVPVFLTLFEELATADIYDLCKDYPDVKFVISNIGYRENRMLGPILDNCPNLYIGSGYYVVHQGIQAFCKYYGAERMIFDTGLPVDSACASVSLINYAEISQEEKELIAHGNIERLLADVKL